MDFMDIASDASEDARRQHRAQRFASEATRCKEAPIPKRSMRAHPGAVVSTNKHEAQLKFFMRIIERGETLNMYQKKAFESLTGKIYTGPEDLSTAMEQFGITDLKQSSTKPAIYEESGSAPNASTNTRTSKQQPKKKPIRNKRRISLDCAGKTQDNTQRRPFRKFKKDPKLSQHPVGESNHFKKHGGPGKAVDGSTTESMRSTTFDDSSQDLSKEQMSFAKVAPNQTENLQKRLRSVKRQLQKIRALERKQVAGVELSAVNLKKLANKRGLEDERCTLREHLNLR